VVVDIGVEHSEGPPAQLKAIRELVRVVESIGLTAAVVLRPYSEVRERRGVGEGVTVGEVAVREKFGLARDRGIGVASDIHVLPGQQQAV